MIKRYAKSIIVGLLLGVIPNATMRAQETDSGDNVQMVSVPSVPANSAQTSYAAHMKNYAAQVYESCKNYKEVCAICAAVICAYVVYSMSGNKKTDIDFSEFENFSSDQSFSFDEKEKTEECVESPDFY